MSNEWWKKEIAYQIILKVLRTLMEIGIGDLKRNY